MKNSNIVKLKEVFSMLLIERRHKKLDEYTILETMYKIQEYYSPYERIELLTSQMLRHFSPDCIKTFNNAFHIKQINLKTLKFEEKPTNYINNIKK